LVSAYRHFKFNVSQYNLKALVLGLVLQLNNSSKAKAIIVNKKKHTKRKREKKT